MQAFKPKLGAVCGGCCLWWSEGFRGRIIVGGEKFCSANGITIEGGRLSELYGSDLGAVCGAVKNSERSRKLVGRENYALCKRKMK
jgi:hypothetical protein